MVVKKASGGSTKQKIIERYHRRAGKDPYSEILTERPRQSLQNNNTNDPPLANNTPKKEEAGAASNGTRSPVKVIPETGSGKDGGGNRPVEGDPSSNSTRKVSQSNIITPTDGGVGQEGESDGNRPHTQSAGSGANGMPARYNKDGQPKKGSRKFIATTAEAIKNGGESDDSVDDKKSEQNKVAVKKDTVVKNQREELSVDHKGVFASDKGAKVPTARIAESGSDRIMDYHQYMEAMEEYFQKIWPHRGHEVFSEVQDAIEALHEEWMHARSANKYKICATSTMLNPGIGDSESEEEDHIIPQSPARPDFSEVLARVLPDIAAEMPTGVKEVSRHTRQKTPWLRTIQLLLSLRKAMTAQTAKEIEGVKAVVRKGIGADGVSREGFLRKLARWEQLCMQAIKLEGVVLNDIAKGLLITSQGLQGIANEHDAETLRADRHSVNLDQYAPVLQEMQEHMELLYNIASGVDFRDRRTGQPAQSKNKSKKRRFHRKGTCVKADR